MLADYEAVPTLAVQDLQQARNFYEGVLGYAPIGDGPGEVRYPAGSGWFLVYQSAYAGTNKATALSLQVRPDAFDSEVADLRTKGVTFQTFEMDGVTWDDGVASMGDQFRAAWFEDPDGNILNIETGT